LTVRRAADRPASSNRDGGPWWIVSIGIVRGISVAVISGVSGMIGRHRKRSK